MPKRQPPEAPVSVCRKYKWWEQRPRAVPRGHRRVRFVWRSAGAGILFDELRVRLKPDTTYVNRSALQGVPNFTRRSRRALAITDNELNVIAALAQIGLMSTPASGYSTPAATGTPNVL